jgi:hypothetical protein
MTESPKFAGAVNDKTPNGSSSVVDNRSPNSAARTWEEAIRDLLKFIA